LPLTIPSDNKLGNRSLILVELLTISDNKLGYGYLILVELDGAWLRYSCRFLDLGLLSVLAGKFPLQVWTRGQLRQAAVNLTDT
jgi:hypothetical protein